VSGVELIERGRSGYPPALEEIPDAPERLYVRGRLPERPCVAVVGSRSATRYGLGLARAFGRALAEAGWPVASGLARGVDGAAHEAVSMAGGIGVAVLGCGPDLMYPPEHTGLAARLVGDGGAVVTEFPPGSRPEPWRFPLRNRIISGLSSVVVVVEASVDGGALITARRALEQGREVFAVPGDVDRSTAAGANLLIRDGAWPVLGPADLVESVARVMGPPPTPPQAARQGTAAVDPLLANLGISGATIDELCVGFGLEAEVVMQRLARLEAAGLVAISDGLVTMA